MPHSPRSAVAAFDRRVAAGAALQGAGTAALAVGVMASVALVAARLCGQRVEPSPWWAVAVVPVVVGAWWRWRRDRLPRELAAQHLDRRLQAGGLLVADSEGVPLDAGWQQVLASRLERLPSALPRLRCGELLLRPTAALATAALLAWWPGNLVPPPAPASFAGLAALDRLGSQLGTLLEQGALPPEVARELQDKLQQLQQAVDGGGQPEWRELDELAQRLQREGLLAAAKLGDGLGAGAGGEGGFAAKLAQQALAKAAEAFLAGAARGGDGAAGGRDALPPALAGMLQRAMQPGGLLDPQQLLRDPAALRELAQTLAGAAAQFQQSGAAAALGAERLAQLQSLVARAGELGKHLMVRNGKPGDGGAGEGTGASAAGRGTGNGSATAQGGAPGDGSGTGDGSASGDGAGGLARGPGFAALRLTDDAQGGADGSLVLPPGAAVPSEWTPIGERLAAPDVAPVQNGGPGGAGAGGSGGASWQLQLAPRHRAVVQRFFPGGGEPTTGQPR